MLSPEEKASRARERMLGIAKQYSTGTYVSKFVAPVFQRMIRAEAASQPNGYVPAVRNGQIAVVWRTVGECVCVTCGKVCPWSSPGSDQLHTGHFLGSRRNSILFDESNVAPQCAQCNKWQNGMRVEYQMWMEHVRGKETIERLEKLKTESRQFTREELVDMRLAYQARLDAALERIG